MTGHLRENASVLRVDSPVRGNGPHYGTTGHLHGRLTQSHGTMDRARDIWSGTGRLASYGMTTCTGAREQTFTGKRLLTRVKCNNTGARPENTGCFGSLRGTIPARAGHHLRARSVGFTYPEFTRGLPGVYPECRFTDGGPTPKIENGSHFCYGYPKGNPAYPPRARQAGRSASPSPATRTHTAPPRTPARRERPRRRRAPAQPRIPIPPRSQPRIPIPEFRVSPWPNVHTPRTTPTPPLYRHTLPLHPCAPPAAPRPQPRITHAWAADPVCSPH